MEKQFGNWPWVWLMLFFYPGWNLPWALLLQGRNNVGSLLVLVRRKMQRLPCYLDLLKSHYMYIVQCMYITSLLILQQTIDSTVEILQKGYIVSEDKKSCELYQIFVKCFCGNQVLTWSNIPPRTACEGLWGWDAIIPSKFRMHSSWYFK